MPDEIQKCPHCLDENKPEIITRHGFKLRELINSKLGGDFCDEVIYIVKCTNCDKEYAVLYEEYDDKEIDEAYNNNISLCNGYSVIPIEKETFQEWVKTKFPKEEIKTVLYVIKDIGTTFAAKLAKELLG